MSVLRGLDLKLYRNSGTYGSPTWVLVDNVKDLAFTQTMDEGDASARLNDVKMLEPTLESPTFGWAMNDDPDDTNLAAIRLAYRNRDLIEFTFADGIIIDAGTHHRRFECKIFDVSEPQPLDGTNVVNVMAKPCYSTNEQGLYTTV